MIIIIDLSNTLIQIIILTIGDLLRENENDIKKHITKKIGELDKCLITIQPG
jgi:hypothetical protein